MKKMDQYTRRVALEKAEQFISTSQFEGYKHPMLIVYLKNSRWEDLDNEVKSPCANHDSETDKILRKAYGDRA